MRRLIRRRPKAPMVVAMTALVVALGGTAAAEPVAQVAAQISGSTIKKRSISGIRVKRNTLTGTEIKESKLGRVPRAVAADTVGGVTMRKVFFRGAANTPPVTVLNLNGLILTASCNAAGRPVVRAATAVNQSVIRRQVDNGGGTNSASNGGFNINQQFDVLGGLTTGGGRLTYGRPDGVVVTVVHQFDESPTFGGQLGCTFFGTAASG